MVFFPGVLCSNFLYQERTKERLREQNLATHVTVAGQVLVQVE